MKPILIATSNSGKLRDFASLAAGYALQVTSIAGFSALPVAVEDGVTFEQNARKKAAYYSRHAPGEIVLADDSGLVVSGLGGAPGVHSARYAASTPHSRNSDEANNKELIRELQKVPEGDRSARFVCVVAAAKDGVTLVAFEGEVEGEIIDVPRGTHGFGYDPHFYLPKLGLTFAELLPEDKGLHSHRGEAFRKFLAWYRKRFG